MNSLSWFLYLADAIPSIGSAMRVVFFILSAVCVVLAIISVFSFDSPRKPEEEKEHLASWKKFIFWDILAFFFFGFIWISTFLIPSQNTIYMIAASESGEMVIDSPEAREMFNDLREIIKGYASNGKGSQELSRR